MPHSKWGSVNKRGPHNVGTWNSMWTYTRPHSVFLQCWRIGFSLSIQSKGVSTEWLQHRAVCVYVCLNLVNTNNCCQITTTNSGLLLYSTYSSNNIRKIVQRYNICSFGKLKKFSRLVNGERTSWSCFIQTLNVSKQNFPKVSSVTKQCILNFSRGKAKLWWLCRMQEFGAECFKQTNNDSNKICI